MGNLFAYLRRRGDPTLSDSPFCEVDNLLLSMLSYFDFGQAVRNPAGPVPSRLFRFFFILFSNENGTRCEAHFSFWLTGMERGVAALR